MKVYSCPKEVPAPQPDYSNYDHAKEQRAEAEHQAALKAWLVKQSYKGKHTGAIYREGVADGYALYMLADGPPDPPALRRRLPKPQRAVCAEKRNHPSCRGGKSVRGDLGEAVSRMSPDGQPFVSPEPIFFFEWHYGGSVTFGMHGTQVEYDAATLLDRRGTRELIQRRPLPETK